MDQSVNIIYACCTPENKGAPAWNLCSCLGEGPVRGEGPARGGGGGQDSLHAAVGWRGELGDLVVQLLVGPVLGDVVQVTVEVHQQRVVAGLQHLSGDGASLLPLPQHYPEHTGKKKLPSSSRLLTTQSLHSEKHSINVLSTAADVCFFSLTELNLPLCSPRVHVIIYWS